MAKPIDKQKILESGAKGGGLGSLKGFTGGKKNLFKTKKLKKIKTKDDSPKGDRVTDSFMREHGWKHVESGREPNTYKYLNEAGKVRAYTAYTKKDKMKPGVSQKTFNNPTLKQLKDWMGY